MRGRERKRGKRVRERERVTERERENWKRLLCIFNFTRRIIFLECEVLLLPSMFSLFLLRDLRCVELYTFFPPFPYITYICLRFLNVATFSISVQTFLKFSTIFIHLPAFPKCCHIFYICANFPKISHLFYTFACLS